MRAALAVAQDFDRPLNGLELRDVADPQPGPGWVRVHVRATSLNMHDVWTLRGVGHPADKLPRILGCDVAGVTDDGREVVVAPVVGDPSAGGGDETLDPRRTLVSENIDGGLAEQIIVPERNLVDKPADLSFEEAACLPVAWGTAYRMLFTRAGVRPGDRVLVQGASGGVNSAAIALAVAAGAKVYATARTPEKQEYARSLGAIAFASGERLPERVEVVVDNVGAATWGHSLRCLQPGGLIVTCGATTGGSPDPELHRVFYQQLRVIGSTAATRSEIESMLRFVQASKLRPHIDRVIGLDEVKDGFAAMIEGDFMGKIVVTP